MKVALPDVYNIRSKSRVAFLKVVIILCFILLLSNHLAVYFINWFLITDYAIYKKDPLLCNIAIQGVLIYILTSRKE